MGLDDRRYGQSGRGGDMFGGRGGGGGGMGMSMPKLTPAVKVLLIINVAVYVLQLFFDQPSRFNVGQMSAYFGVTVNSFWQLWRYVTFQFLHATGDIWHLVMNMLRDRKSVV